MTVIVTRPGEPGLELVSMLINNNIPAIHLPLFTFSDGEDLNLLTEKLNRLNTGDWLFPVSIQAIEFANKELQKQHYSWPSSINYLAVGKKSAERLSTITKQNVVYPAHQESSEGLLKLFEQYDLDKKNFLILRANNGRDLFANYLRKRGTEVQILNCYNRKSIQYNRLEILNKIKKASRFVVTSSANLMALHKLFSHYCLSYKHCILITISERLVLQAQKLGWEKIQLSTKVNNQFLYNAVQSTYK